eukprot:CCRYP_019639-RB/>CCRYP_019639-RB protein AED:0.00 eAED:0.00 QI:435/1/1/1/1/1/3/1953/869
MVKALYQDRPRRIRNITTETQLNSSNRDSSSHIKPTIVVVERVTTELQQLNRMNNRKSPPEQTPITTAAALSAVSVSATGIESSSSSRLLPMDGAPSQNDSLDDSFHHHKRKRDRSGPGRLDGADSSGSTEVTSGSYGTVAHIDSSFIAAHGDKYPALGQAIQQPSPPPDNPHPASPDLDRPTKRPSSCDDAPMRHITLDNAGGVSLSGGAAHADHGAMEEDSDTDEGQDKVARKDNEMHSAQGPMSAATVPSEGILNLAEDTTQSPIGRSEVMDLFRGDLFARDSPDVYQNQLGALGMEIGLVKAEGMDVNDYASSDFGMGIQQRPEPWASGGKSILERRRSCLDAKPSANQAPAEQTRDALARSASAFEPRQTRTWDNENSRSAFADIEAKLTQRLCSSMFHSSAPEDTPSLDTKPAAVSNANSRQDVANLDAEVMQRYNLDSAKEPFVHNPSSISELMQEGKAEMLSSQIESSFNLEPSIVSDSKQVALAYSRSVFAHLEEELTRQEEEAQRAQVSEELSPSSFAHKTSTFSLYPGSRRQPSSSSNFNSMYNSYHGTSDVAEYGGTMNGASSGSPFEGQVGSHGIVANMEVLAGQRPPPPPPAQLPRGIGHQNRDTETPSPGLGGQRSREIIASIEADILRQQEEEDRSEVNANHGMSNNSIQMVLGPYSSNYLSRSTLGARRGQNPNLMLSMITLQQHRQHVQSHSTRTNLVNQVSNMAVEPIDDDSVNSIESCLSYDGKITNINGIHCQTQEQLTAWQRLDDAVNDLISAPVMPILREYPMLTRFVSADNDSGDIQLHHAVTNGNSKAIRRMLRVDPSCALIRNAEGYCPLHTAAQIGNFAAVQLLCAMVPASAEVQVSLLSQN